MLYSDFNTVFDSLDICNYDASCSYFSEKLNIGKNMKNGELFRIEITTSDEYIF